MMTTNADKIAAWRGAHPLERITQHVLLDVLGLDTLHGARLTDAELTDADLAGANLHGANLHGARLAYADLTNADLAGARLYGARLTDARLTNADLAGANLYDARLHGASLTNADLAGASLYGARLHGATWDGITLDCGPSGRGWYVGGEVSIGCWKYHTLDALRTLIEDPAAEWPEAKTDAEKERRRPYLRAALATCEAHDTYQSGVTT